MKNKGLALVICCHSITQQGNHRTSSSTPVELGGRGVRYSLISYSVSWKNKIATCLIGESATCLIGDSLCFGTNKHSMFYTTGCLKSSCANTELFFSGYCTTQSTAWCWCCVTTTESRLLMRITKCLICNSAISTPFCLIVLGSARLFKDYRSMLQLSFWYVHSKRDG